MYCECQPGPTRVAPPRQDGGGTRAPALHALDDVLRLSRRCGLKTFTPAPTLPDHCKFLKLISPTACFAGPKRIIEQRFRDLPGSVPGILFSVSLSSSRRSLQKKNEARRVSCVPDPYSCVSEFIAKINSIPTFFATCTLLLQLMTSPVMPGFDDK